MIECNRSGAWTEEEERVLSIAKLMQQIDHQFGEKLLAPILGKTSPKKNVFFRALPKLPLVTLVTGTSFSDVKNNVLRV